MADEKPKESQHAAGEAWNEVGQQFRALGESLASAFKVTWQSEETRQHLEGMQAGLEALVDEISQVTKKVADSEEAKKVQVQAEKVAQSAKSASQQTTEEMRPHLLAAFRKIRAELDQMISRIEHDPATSETPTDQEPSASETTE